MIKAKLCHFNLRKRSKSFNGFGVRFSEKFFTRLFIPLVTHDVSVEVNLIIYKCRSILQRLKIHNVKSDDLKFAKAFKDENSCILVDDVSRISQVTNR